MADMFKKIVVAVDGSEQSLHALTVACDIAKKYRSEIYLVHSPQLETTGIAVGSGAVEIAPSAEQIAEAGKSVVDGASEKAKALGCPPAGCVIENGDPASEILKAIESTGADLVVMGRRGLGRISSALLGSVSQKVGHDANCTCMTVC